MLLGVSSVPIRFGRRQTCVILGTLILELIARLPLNYPTACCSPSWNGRGEFFNVEDSYAGL